MDINLTTPALLFPAISLLLLAYTNRFLAIASVVRNLHSVYKETSDQVIFAQIRNLKLRLILTRNMQAFGALSMLGCVISMFLIFSNHLKGGRNIFALSLILLIVSLLFSVYEIYISVNALKIQLKDLEEEKKRDIK